MERYVIVQKSGDVHSDFFIQQSLCRWSVYYYEAFAVCNISAFILRVTVVTEFQFLTGPSGCELSDLLGFFL